MWTFTYSRCCSSRDSSPRSTTSQRIDILHVFMHLNYVKNRIASEIQSIGESIEGGIMNTKDLDAMTQEYLALPVHWAFTLWISRN